MLGKRRVWWGREVMNGERECWGKAMLEEECLGRSRSVANPIKEGIFTLINLSFNMIN